MWTLYYFMLLVKLLDNVNSTGFNIILVNAISYYIFTVNAPSRNSICCGIEVSFTEHGDTMSYIPKTPKMFICHAPM